MDFCFKKNESVSKAIRRLSGERIQSARDCLKDWHRAEAIHEARKDIKKVRAVLRLVRRRIAHQAQGRLRRMLREAATYLAASRDASVRVETLRALTRRSKGRIASATVHHVGTALRAAAAQEAKRFAEEDTAKAVDRTLRRVARELDHLDVEGKGWKALSPGVRMAYSRGCRAYRTARKNGSPKNLHEWRKRAKDLWYHVTLLRPIRPRQMDATAGALEKLGDLLGNHHDLVMLREAVGTLCGGDGDTAEVESLAVLIEERQRELCDAALALGARFYAEKPAVFRDRLARYWLTWRRKKQALGLTGAKP